MLLCSTKLFFDKNVRIQVPMEPDSVGQKVAVYSRAENPIRSSSKLILIEDDHYN
jgi:hypothetical protein